MNGYSLIEETKAQESLRNNLWNKLHENPMEKMDKLPNQDTIVIDPSDRCVGQNINLVGTYIIDLGEVPTIISA